MAKGKVFIIENDAGIVEDYRKKLETLGYEVAGVVSDASDALKHGAIQGCDVALMNIKLNVQLLKGRTANKLIQQKFEIPVVFFSADKLFDEATLSSVLEKVLRIYSR